MTYGVLYLANVAMITCRKELIQSRKEKRRIKPEPSDWSVLVTSMVPLQCSDLISNRKNTSYNQRHCLQLHHQAKQLSKPSKLFRITLQEEGHFATENVDFLTKQMGELIKS